MPFFIITLQWNRWLDRTRQNALYHLIRSQTDTVTVHSWSFYVTLFLSIYLNIFLIRLFVCISVESCCGNHSWASSLRSTSSKAAIDLSKCLCCGADGFCEKQDTNTDSMLLFFFGTIQVSKINKLDCVFTRTQNLNVLHHDLQPGRGLMNWNVHDSVYTHLHVGAWDSGVRTELKLLVDMTNT